MGGTLYLRPLKRVGRAFLRVLFLEKKKELYLFSPDREEAKEEKGGKG